MTSTKDLIMKGSIGNIVDWRNSSKRDEIIKKYQELIINDKKLKKG